MSCSPNLKPFFELLMLKHHYLNTIIDHQMTRNLIYFQKYSIGMCST